MNNASSHLRSQQRGAQQAANLATERKRFDDFSKRNGISVWVTASQLSADPFKYEGKVVGLIVQLDPMETWDTALDTGAIEDDGGKVQLHGINPDFPDSSHSVLMAVKVGQREPLAGSDDKIPVFTGIARMDSATCSEEGCGDWLEWSYSGGSRIQWGAPYTPGG